jgi:hypothetical protein
VELSIEAWSGVNGGPKSQLFLPRPHPCGPIGPDACSEHGCKKRGSWGRGNVELERLVPPKSLLAWVEECFDLDVLCLIALPLQNHTLPSRDGCKTSATITVHGSRQ